MELQTLKIPSVMICDTMVGSLFQHHQIHGVGEALYLLINSDRTHRSLSVVGADRIAKNGDTANKVGEQ